MNSRTATNPFAMVSRAVIGALVVVGILLIGYATPVETVFAGGVDTPAAAAPIYGNGSTGYFPDMFSIVEDAGEPAEPAPTF